MDTLQSVTGGGGTIILGWLTSSIPILTFEHGHWLLVYLLFVSFCTEVYKVSFCVSHIFPLCHTHAQKLTQAN